MTRREEVYLLDTIERIDKEVHENNMMLRHIIKILNAYIINHRNENEDDFGRNILANLISNGLNINKLNRKL